MSEEDFDRRWGLQMDIEEKGRRADFVIDNSVDECALWQWSAAMQMVIDQERQKQQEVDRFDITNRIDR